MYANKWKLALTTTVMWFVVETLLPPQLDIHSATNQEALLLPLIATYFLHILTYAPEYHQNQIRATMRLSERTKK